MITNEIGQQVIKKNNYFIIIKNILFRIIKKYQSEKTYCISVTQFYVNVINFCIKEKLL